MAHHGVKLAAAGRVAMRGGVWPPKRRWSSRGPVLLSEAGPVLGGASSNSVFRDGVREGAGPSKNGGDTIFRGYETLLIFDPTVEEESIEAGIDKVISLITEGEGTVVEVNRWGKNPLAYEVGKNKFGFYVLVEFFAEPTLLSELDEHLKLDSSVLRHSTGRTWVEPPPELVKKVSKKPKRKALARKKTAPKRKSKKTEKKPKEEKPSGE